MSLTTELSWLAVGFAYVVAGILVVILSKYVKDRFTSFNLDDELTKKDNPAVGVATAGYFIAVLIVFLGASVGPSPGGSPIWTEIGKELAVDLAYAIAGILALNLNRILIDRCILYKFSIRKEIIEDRNTGTGAVEAGCMIASALVIAGAIHGQGDIVTALVFCVAGLAILIVFGLFFQWITPYDIHHEIEADNVPAGVELGMMMVAIGVILLKATYADFYSWSENFTILGLYAIGGFITLIVVRKLVNVALLPGTTLEHEIVRDRNMNAALIQGAMTIGTAVSVFFMF
jgi:uncharacterized membrane protein YjfL (UPF0719 family)